jgi:serine/threonine protein kinase
MWGSILIVAIVLAFLSLAVWIYRTDFLLHVAGVDPGAVRTVPDRARYSSMGAVILLTAGAATASLTVALSLVFPHHGWAVFLPVGILWGAIVFNFDRWIVSSVDYGPLSAGEAGPSRHWARASKAVQFGVRFIMAALVGLVISEPIVLAIFSPEIDQQLTAQHVADTRAQTAQIEAAAGRQIAILGQPVTAARQNLAAATRKANRAHKIYLCELTAQCHLPPGEVTGVPGAGPQTAQDYVLWRQALAAQNKAQRALDQASKSQAAKAAVLNGQTRNLIAHATKTIDADNGLLARERALDTLTRQNPGFLLRRLLLWLALMFIDLAPVLLKTFSPPTLYETLERGAAVRTGRTTMAEAVADADHESAKNAVTREFDLKTHRLAAETRFHRAVAEARPPSVVPAGRSAGVAGGAQVIGRRWRILRPVPDVPEQGRVPYVATDSYGEYPFEVVVKVIAPPPGIAGWQGLGERLHAQMEMSLPLGHIHENIAEVLDCDLDPEHGFYIVTRMYPSTLERYLREADGRDSLTMGEVLRLAEQMLAGLRAAWDRDVVHLDLKPANVALTENRTVKLIDFGLAKHYQGINGGNYTATAARFTPFYAPPEQMERRDGSWISRNADIRALGAVIYRMLTGYPPMFREARAVGLIDARGRALAGDAATYLRLTALISSAEPVGVADLISYVPPDLDLLLRGWLRIDPEMRCPGNPKGVAERAWLELTAVLERVHAAGEADYPVGPRVTQEPDFTELRARWHHVPAAATRAGGARTGATLELLPADPVQAGEPGGQSTVPGVAGGAAARWYSNGSRNGDGTP